MKYIPSLTAGITLALSLSPAVFAQHYTQTNLDANTSGAAEATDPQLVNGWGISRGPGSVWWVSDQGTGVATLYNGPGVKQSLVVTIPKSDPNDKTFPHGTPTGTIFNGSTTDFLIAPQKQAVFLFATLDGSIAAWNPTVGLAQGANPPSTNAVTVARGDAGSGYTGLTAATIDGDRYLYAANFLKGRIDVYDNNFKAVKLPTKGRGHHDSFFDDQGIFDNNKPFTDDRLPRNYVPFNVLTIGNDLVVTYALHFAGNPFETPGPGLGYVDIYSSDGRLLRRLEHGDWLNAPWGIALAPLDFGKFSHRLLISNFAAGGTTQSAGFISAYDLATGKFEGLLEDTSGKPLAINGIWGISFANPAGASPTNPVSASYDPDEAPAAQLYFAAGPNQGTAGLFGYLTPLPAEQVQGNDQ